jgi:hypothetical protein
MIEIQKFIKITTSVAATRTLLCREPLLLELKIYRPLVSGKIVLLDQLKIASLRNIWKHRKLKRSLALNSMKKYNNSYLKAINTYKMNKLKFNKTLKDLLQKKL